MEAGPKDPIVFDALWTGVINDWDNEDRHHRFLDHARQDSAGLVEAAARYRQLKDDEARGAVAKKRLSAIVLLATAEMLAQKTEPRKVPPRWVTALAVSVCLALLGWVFMAYAR